MPFTTTAPAVVHKVHSPGLDSHVKSTLSSLEVGNGRSGISQIDSSHNVQNWDHRSTVVPPSNGSPSWSSRQSTGRPIGNMLDSLAAGSVVVVGHPINNDPPAFDYQGTMNSNPDGTTFTSLDYPMDIGGISSTTVDAGVSHGHVDTLHAFSDSPDIQVTETTQQTDLNSSGNTYEVSSHPRSPVNLVLLSAEGANLTANILGIPMGLGLPQSALAYLNTPINSLIDSNGVGTRVMVAIEQVWNIISQFVTGRPMPSNNVTAT
jgi:hypothetical protein